MSEVTLSCKAYAKIVMHAAKYPHCSLNGILLALSDKVKDNIKNQKIPIVDSIPLFHQCLHVTPMAELALSQIDAMCSTAGLTIVGYYAATDNIMQNTIDKAPAVKIAEKIAEIFPSALFLMVDNRKFSMDLKNHALTVAQFSEGKWKPKDVSQVKVDENILDCVSRLLKTAAYKNLVDFDNHLDDISQDWTNAVVNSQINQLMKMYDEK